MGGAVTVEDAVPASVQLSGQFLRTAFMPSISTVTLGLVRLRDRTQYVGPVPIHTFGPPSVKKNSVTWPILGGLLAAAPGGSITVVSTPTELRARVDGYRPMLPRSIYQQTQLRLHHALVRVQLLRLAELAPPGEVAGLGSRAAAAGIDVAVCAGLTLAFARRRRLGAFVRIAAGYHLACWSTSGRTLGGRVMGQRVVSVDGSRLSLFQSALRLAALPLAALRRYPAHDDIAATTVVSD